MLKGLPQDLEVVIEMSNGRDYPWWDPASEPEVIRLQQMPEEALRMIPHIQRAILAGAPVPVSYDKPETTWQGQKGPVKGEPCDCVVLR